ncbi:MAG: cytochrome c [Polyangiales bacterium]
MNSSSARTTLPAPASFPRLILCASLLVAACSSSTPASTTTTTPTTTATSGGATETAAADAGAAAPTTPATPATDADAGAAAATPTTPATPETTPATPATTPATPAVDTAAIERGHTVFNRACGRCHEDGERGGPAANANLEEASVTRTVRSGHGRMRAIPVARLSDADLALVIGYLRSIHAVR